MLKRNLPAIVLTSAVALLAHGLPAHTEGVLSPRMEDNLPGVDRDASERANLDHNNPTEPVVPEADDEGFVRYGNWGVRVSGKVTVDIGAGNVRPPDD